LRRPSRMLYDIRVLDGSWPRPASYTKAPDDGCCMVQAYGPLALAETFNVHFSFIQHLSA
jgi:hypothetical protein